MSERRWRVSLVLMHSVPALLGDVGTAEAFRRSIWQQAIHQIGVVFMAVHRRLEVAEVGDVTVVRFVDRKILDEGNIQEMGQELFQLVEEEKRGKILLN